MESSYCSCPPTRAPHPARPCSASLTTDTMSRHFLPPVQHCSFPTRCWVDSMRGIITRDQIVRLVHRASHNRHYRRVFPSNDPAFTSPSPSKPCTGKEPRRIQSRTAPPEFRGRRSGTSHRVSGSGFAHRRDDRDDRRGQRPDHHPAEDDRGGGDRELIPAHHERGHAEDHEDRVDADGGQDSVVAAQ